MMDESLVSRQSVVWAVAFSIFVLAILFVASFFDPETRVFFCDVGQGDAAYIRTKEKVDILIDAGPDRKVLSCLGKYMPFYDRKIELAFLTHPQKDHYGGFLYLLDRYQIDHLITVPVENDNQSFNLLREKLISQDEIKMKNLSAGERVLLKDGMIEFLWPEREFLAQNAYLKKDNLSSNGNVLAAYTSTTSLNKFSQVFIFSWHQFDILFTGDIPADLLDKIGSSYLEGDFGKIEILKVPHHGSKNGLTADFLTLVDPALSIISVAKNNSYGHPNDQVLALFESLKKKYLRTDEKGHIVIEVDDKGWKIIN